MLAELSLRHSSVILVVFKVIVLLEDDPSAPSLSSLDLFFFSFKKKIKNQVSPFSVLATLTSVSVPFAEKHPHSIMLPSLCVTVEWSR